ncbi:DUF4019 domain-containing protein [uncultured Brevundimonas sp.]|uniref:helix-turn-helix domain-containing protein n=1 Tax=uncultured Brevundimonas sp. TaxID=213418 RepID=UPI0026247BF2|nr:DUF4019 domain-containing protein [uncultured Brevundimonas sp.]
MNAELFETLTDREKDVLRLLVAGHEAKSVAQVLGLSVHTVNEYLRSARRKLDAPNSRAAARQLAAFEQETYKNSGDPEFLGNKESGEDHRASGGHRRGLKAGGKVRLALILGGLMPVLLILASVIALTTGVVTVSGPSQSATAEAADALPAKAVTEADNWLKYIDADDWAGSHAAFDPIVKENMSAQEWEANVKPVREGLGTLLGREKLTGSVAENLQGMPEGRYGVQQYQSQFENHDIAVETVVLRYDAGDWKVIAYLVR